MDDLLAAPRLEAFAEAGPEAPSPRVPHFLPFVGQAGVEPIAEGANAGSGQAEADRAMLLLYGLPTTGGTPGLADGGDLRGKQSEDEDDADAESDVDLGDQLDNLGSGL